MKVNYTNIERIVSNNQKSLHPLPTGAQRVKKAMVTSSKFFFSQFFCFTLFQVVNLTFANTFQKRRYPSCL